MPAAEAETLGARYVSREALLREADHLVIVVPYSAESHHLVGAAELALMKPTATLVNIARGGVVDDVALAAALREGRIAAAGLDVFEGEPAVHPDLLACRNVVLTPHIASASLPTRRAMAIARRREPDLPARPGARAGARRRSSTRRRWRADCRSEPTGRSGRHRYVAPRCGVDNRRA